MERKELLLDVFSEAEEAAVQRRKGARMRRRRRWRGYVIGRKWRSRRGTEETGRPEGRPRERTTSCADGVLAAGASRLAAGQRRKTKRDATINLRTEAVRLLRIRARSRDRPPGRRRRATAVLATARVTTLGSCGGGGGAQRQTQRRNGAWSRRRAVISQLVATVNLGLAPSWRFCWRCLSGAILGTSCVRPFNFTA